MVRNATKRTRRNTMKLTLSQAAKEAKVAKSTISRAIEKGRLSATKDDLGRFLIDPSELFRVFSPQQRNTPETQQIEQGATGLERELEHLRSMLSMMREQLNDTKTDRDHWRDQAKQLAITHDSSDKSSTWWKRLVG